MSLLIPSRQAARSLGVLTLVVLLCAISPASGATSTSSDGQATRAIYWGAQINEQLTGEKAPWDMSAVRKFQRLAGKGLSLVEFAGDFAECGSSGCVMSRFPTTPLENVRQYGAIPVFTWNTSASPGSTANQGPYRLANVINGTYDSYIRGFAEKARAWGHPFFLRFDPEMNGFWFPWNEGVNGNMRGEYVAAWRHVHDIFTAAGATNASWVWCPNVDIHSNLRALRPLYPGSNYVDWTCLDGFNWGKRRGSPGWLSFDQIYRSTYRRIVGHIAPRKPMMLAELASTDRGGSKPAWIRDMLRTVRTGYGKVRGIIWYDVNDRGTHWPIETSRRVVRAFRSGIRARAFVPNLFGDLATSPIPPPAAR